MKSYMGNLNLPSSVEVEKMYNSCLDIDPRPLPPGTQSNPHKPAEEGVLNPSDKELVLQWHQPTLEESDPSRHEIDSLDKRIILLYALGKKSGSSDTIGTPGFLWVSHAQLVDLHDRLAVLVQRGEISLTEKEKVKKEITPATPIPAKPKKTQRIKALSPKPQRDEQLEGLLRQCVEDCTLLLSSSEDHDAVNEIPFEVNRANIKNLEQLFDSSFGLMLRGTDISTWITKLLS